MASFPHLFQPIRIGNFEIRNRIVQLAMQSWYPAEDGSLTPLYENSLLDRAKGGAGMIIAAVGTPWPKEPEGYPGLYKDEFIAPFRKFVDAIHGHGAKLAVQLITPRHLASFPTEPLGPSDVSGFQGEHPHPLTVEEIHWVIDEYSEAARRARDAGIDAVELQCGMGYLISRFLSSFANKRTDEYGGPLENRMRFLLEMIAAIKKKVGNDYPLMCRFSAQELMEGGNTFDEQKIVARRLEEVGICCLDVQVGFHESTVPMVQQWVPPAAFVDVPLEIKKIVKVPVIGAYRIAHPAVAERVLAEGKADIIGMARALIADPELPNKAREGRVDDIRYCIACCRCLEDTMGGMQVHCTVNGGAGREPITAATTRKRVVVVGGGPGGLETARIAAQRGHTVTLLEKGRRLGGLMTLASVLNDQIEPLCRWMVAQTEKLPITVMAQKEATPAVIQAMKPDAVILASGGIPITLNVPGVDGDNVISGQNIKDLINGVNPRKGKGLQRLLWALGTQFTKYVYNVSLMRWSLGSNLLIGKRVVVIGAQFAGLELAQALAEAGKQVTVLEETKRIGSDVVRVVRWVELKILEDLKVNVQTLVTVTGITDKGVQVSRADGSSGFFEADTVFTVPGRSVQANPKLIQELEKTAPAFHAIGDCAEPGRIREALNAGYEIASKI